MDKLYGDYWEQGVGHSALFTDDSELEEKLHISKWCTNKIKALQKIISY